MNPKTPQDLDPKLKEAYDRVMGGNFTPPAPATPNPAPKIEPAPLPTASPIPPSTPFNNPAPPVGNPPLSVISPTTTTQNGEQVVTTKKKSKISPVIFLIVGLAFFAVYAVVWAKVFKLF
ncbi:MAG: hypothetical protein M1405_02095 [Patescibacteria group bacterium]|nr:hypothetical protein [Patescibacteria group bacterium]